MAQREDQVQVELSQLGGGGLRSRRLQSPPNGTGAEIRDGEAETDHGRSAASWCCWWRCPTPQSTPSTGTGAETWDLEAATRRPASCWLNATDALISHCPWPQQQSLPEVSFPLCDYNVRFRCLLHNVPVEIGSTETGEHGPSYVSIGPYHYMEGGLKNRSELWKQHCLDKVRSFLGGNADLKLDDTMTSIEAQVKQYYDASSFPTEQLSNGSGDFCDIMKTDGCFLLITLGGLEPDVSTTSGNELLWDHLLMWHDIFLYGNQLPFIVVWEIYQLIHQDETNVSVLLQKMEDKLGQDLVRYTNRKVSELGRPEHLLHLYHLLLKPTVKPDPQQTVIMVRWWRRAMEYIRQLLPNNTEDRQENGVKVGRWRRATEYSDAQCISDVRVHGHLVEIPKLELDTHTWKLLRNLMLLEQANWPGFGTDVIAYCTFISQLASTSADVSFLMKRGIIVHREASDEKAAEKLNKLCSQIAFYRDKENYLKSEWQELDKHCRKWGWRQLAKVRRYKDWNNLMVVLGTFAAFVLLVCTIVQSVYTVLTYIN